MDKIEHRAVIKLLMTKGLKAMEIHNEMVNVLGDDAPSKTILSKWTLKFQDDPRPGRSKSVTIAEMINSVHDMVMDGSPLT